MQKLIHISNKIFPNSIKTRISKTGIYNKINARILANTSKRLDICSAQIAYLLHISNFTNKYPVKEKTCLEIGSGWLLSHSIVFHLLGAKNVIATDIYSIAQPSYLNNALNKSVISVIRDILSPFEDHHIIRNRINNLLKIQKFSFETLKEIGIEYIAPLNLVKQKLDLKVDFIYSNAVLEHIPIDEITPLLNNLAKILVKDGIMIHCIHMEDHKNIKNDPFAFLVESEVNFSKEVQTNRGNRIRYSQWKELLKNIEDMEFKLIYKFKRIDKKLPKMIDSSIKYIDEEDLRISHMGILGKKI